MPVTYPNRGNAVPRLSSITPLGAGATFTSPWVAVEDVATIRVGVLSSHDGNLRTQHSDDGGVTILRDSHQPVTANKGEFLSFHPRSQFFRIVYDNPGAAQSLFHLSTVFHSVALGLTQSLVSAPLARTSLAAQARAIIYDYKYDSHATVIPGTKELLVSNRNSLIADAFVNGMLDTTLWTPTLTGTGSAAIVTSRLELGTGTTANSTAKLVSATNGRFIAGNIQGHKSGIVTPDAGTANNIRRWGTYNDVDGFFFELNGTTLYAVGRQDGVDTKVASPDWSDVSTYTHAAATPASYEISFGVGTAWFIVNDEVHHVMFGGGRKGSFPNRYENNNSGGSTTNVLLRVLGSIQQRYGPVQNTPRFKNLSGAATTILKVGPGHLSRIIVGDGSGANTATLYDNTAGSGLVIATLNVNKLQGTLDFGTDFSNGLTIVTTGADTNLTVVFD